MNWLSDWTVNDISGRVPMAAYKAAVIADPAKLVGWDAEPAGKVSLDWGSLWATGKSSLLAKVPSIIVPEEWNVLINPAHPDFVSVKATKVRKWLYDMRLSPGKGATA